MQVETVRRFGLGEDGIVVAPTGSGKSATWEIAALMNPDKVYVIVVALDAIREEQVRNYTGTSIKALGLDPEVLSGRQTYRTETQIDTEDLRQTTEQQRLRRKAQLLKDIQDGAFNLIFASPEMLFSSGPIVQILSRPSFRDRLGGIFVDEAHVVDEWGVRKNARTHQPFRAKFGKLRVLRALVGVQIPVLACTATLPRSALPNVWTALDFGQLGFFACDAGADRSNVRCEVRPMKFSNRSFRDLTAFFSSAAKRGGELPKTIIYCRTKREAVKAVKVLRAYLGQSLHHAVRHYTAMGTRGLKKKPLSSFFSSTDNSVRILVATEAAGMGVDVSDVDLIIQYRLPRTLTEFVQHAGRAMRNQDQRGVAVLLVEPWAWQPDELKPVSQTVKARQATIPAPLRRFLSGKECRRLIIKEEMALDFEWIRKQTVTFEELSLPLGASSAAPSSTISATSPSSSVSATRPRRPHAKPRCLWNEDLGLGPSIPPSCCDVCNSKSPVIIYTLEEASSSSTQNRSIKGYRIPRAHPSLSPLRQDFITHLLEWRQSYFDQRRKIEAFLPSPEIVLSDLSLVRVATMAGRMVKLAEINVRFETEPMRQLIGEEAETLSDQLIGTLVVSCDAWARKSTSQSFAGHLTKGGDWKEPPKG